MSVEIGANWWDLLSVWFRHRLVCKLCVLFFCGICDVIPSKANCDQLSRVASASVLPGLDSAWLFPVLAVARGAPPVFSWSFHPTVCQKCETPWLNARRGIAG